MLNVTKLNPAVTFKQFKSFNTINSELQYGPGGPGPRIYISQEHSGPVIPPGNGFPFRRLLRLAGLRRKYSNPPPRGVLSPLSQSHIATDGQSVSLSVEQHQIFITLRQLWSCSCWVPSLTRGRVCILYMLLALASVVFLGSESLETCDQCPSANLFTRNTMWSALGLIRGLRNENPASCCLRGFSNLM
jgi:hypothetical protein